VHALVLLAILMVVLVLLLALLLLLLVLVSALVVPSKAVQSLVSSLVSSLVRLHNFKQKCLALATGGHCSRSSSSTRTCFNSASALRRYRIQ
jgi:hypothetical protein